MSLVMFICCHAAIYNQEAIPDEQFVTKRACPLNQCIASHMTMIKVVREVVNMGFSKQRASLLLDELLS